MKKMNIDYLVTITTCKIMTTSFRTVKRTIAKRPMKKLSDIEIYVSSCLAVAEARERSTKLQKSGLERKIDEAYTFAYRERTRARAANKRALDTRNQAADMKQAADALKDDSANEKYKSAKARADDYHARAISSTARAAEVQESADTARAALDKLTDLRDKMDAETPVPGTFSAHMFSPIPTTVTVPVPVPHVPAPLPFALPVSVLTRQVFSISKLNPSLKPTVYPWFVPGETDLTSEIQRRNIAARTIISIH